MLKGALLGLANRRSVYQLITRYGLLSDIAWRYVAGERLQDGVAVARALNGRGLHVSLDHLGESVSSEAEAAEATSAYLDALKAIGTEHLAANISLKLTQLGLDLSPDLARDNLRRVLECARATGDVFVRLDMESSVYTDRTLDLH